MTEEEKTGEQNQTTESIAKADYDKAVQRAQKFEGQLVDVQKQLDKFKDINPDEFHAMKQALAEQEKKAAENDPEKLDKLIKKTRDELATKFQADVEKETQRATKAETELKTLRVTNVATQKAIALGALPKSLTHIERVVNEVCDYKDGQIIIKDERGEPRYSEKKRNEYMTIDEFLESFSQEHDYMFATKYVSGAAHSGAQPSRPANGRPMTYEVYAGLSTEERAKVAPTLDDKTKTEFARRALGFSV